MKKIITSFFALLLIAGCTPPKEEIDVAKEEEAIKAVIKEEVAQFLDRDYISEAEFWKNADYVTSVHNMVNSHNLTVGWDSIFVLVKKASEMEGWQHVTNFKVDQKDFNIKVYDKVAWAVYYVQHTGEYEGEPFDNSFSRVTFLEKVGDNWKIVLLTNTRLDPCKTDDAEDDQDEDDDD